MADSPLASPSASLPASDEAPASSLDVAVLEHIGTALTSTLSLPEVLRVLMDQVEAVLAPHHWSLLLHDPEANVLRFEIAAGEECSELAPLSVQLGEGIAGWVFSQQMPLTVADAYTDARFEPAFDKQTGFTTGPLLGVPLIHRATCLGVIEIVRARGEAPFTDAEQTALLALADFAAIAIFNAQYLATIKELTIQDEVTALYNVRHLHHVLDQEINRAKRYDGVFATIFLDMDHFKNVNDTHGHLVGSAVLKEVGEVLLESLRDSDLAFRYGGDEFVVVLPNTDAPGALVVAERLRASLKGKRLHPDLSSPIHLSASFGVAAYPENATSREELLRMADAAMYRIKNTTRDGVTSG